MKRNVIASVSDDAVMRTILRFVDICLQVQLYLLSFDHLVIVSGFRAADPKGTMTSSTTIRKVVFCFSIPFSQGFVWTL